MSQINLEIAKCCGTCTGANSKSKSKPEDHAPHYMVAKTERWCQKHGIPTVREAVCSDWKLEPKKGGVPAVKRALSQNRRLQAILKLKKKLEFGAIGWNGYTFAISTDGFVVCNYPHSSSEYWYRLSCKENRFDKFLFGDDEE